MQIALLLTIIILLLVIILFCTYFRYFLDYHSGNIDYSSCSCYKTKNIAVLLSGQIRQNYQTTLETQLVNIIKPLNADVFFDFDDTVSEDDKTKIVEYLQPKKYQWRSYSQTSNLTEKNKNILMMYERKFNCNKLKKLYEDEINMKYDIVIRLRPDLIIKDKIPEYIINNVQENVLYYPKINEYDVVNDYFGFGINDQIYLSTSTTMNKFVKIFEHISKMYEDYDELTSEKVAKNYLNEIQVSTQTYNQRFLLDQYAFDMDDPQKVYNGFTKYVTKWM